MITKYYGSITIDSDIFEIPGKCEHFDISKV